MLTHPQFDPVALQIGPLALRWYGLMYLAAFASFYLLGRWRLSQPQFARQSGMTARDLEDVLFYGALGVVLGGRLGYVLFYKPAYYLAHPLEIVAVWQGGMAFHGGLIGVIVATWWYCRRRGHDFWRVIDLVAPLVPLGLAAGRLGNFINGELWGRATDLPWAMVFPQAGDGVARHPSQLYQFAGEGLVLFALLWWFSQSAARPRRGVGPVPRRLRRDALRSRVRARTGRVPRYPAVRPVDGPVAVRPDVRRRPLSDAAPTGILMFEKIQKARRDARDRSELERLLADCRKLLTERGESNSVAIAARVIERYRTLPADAVHALFSVLAAEFDPDPGEVLMLAEQYAVSRSPENLIRLARAAEPPRQELLRRLNQAPQGTATIVAMRAQLLNRLRSDRRLAAVDADFEHLLSSWFSPGFLNLVRVDWDSPARCWNRSSSTRRCTRSTAGATCAGGSSRTGAASRSSIRFCPTNR